MARFGSFETHPVLDVFPLMEGADFDELRNDIAAHGLQIPLLKRGRTLLDGRNRLRACIELGIEPRFEEFEGADATAAVVAANLRRRHLTESQRALVAARLAALPKGRPRRGTAAAEAPTQAQAAALTGVSERLTRAAKAVLEAGDSDLTSAVERGQLAVTAAESMLKRPEGERERVLQLVMGGQAFPAAVRAARTPAPTNGAPTDGYQVVVIDHDNWDAVEAAAPPLAPDCHVWVRPRGVAPRRVLRLLQRWGLQWQSFFVWVRPEGSEVPAGEGLPLVAAEVIFHASRGKLQLSAPRERVNLFEGEPREGNSLPVEFYSELRALTSGRRLDMFGRAAQPGYELPRAATPAEEPTLRTRRARGNGRAEGEASARAS